VLSILVSMKHRRPEERDCALTVRHGEGTTDLDLRVRAVPLSVEGHDLVLLALSDVSQAARHASMERAFLHDVSNVLTGLIVAADAIGSPDVQEAAAAALDVGMIADLLVREVRIQRMLSTSTLEDYQVSVQPVPVARLFEDLARLFNRLPAAANRSLEVVLPEVRVVSTDPFLLARILTNMLKNAFEATPPGGEVRLAAREVDGAVRFEVHNPGAIPAAVVPRIFQRHFTTKAGPGHGEGTWSMRTLGEQLLHGTVGFDTDRVAGTTFWFRLPQAARPAA
jgi:signal transduction histidine kinase